MPAATRDDWKALAAPSLREPLGYSASFDIDTENELSSGLIPQCMEDKWFIYRDDDWLYFHRSWTGALIYWLRLDTDTDTIRVAESWVNRDTSQYSSTDTPYDRALVDYLIRRSLFRENVPFPMPKVHGFRGLLFKLAGKAMLFQHSLVGTSNVSSRKVDDSNGG